MSEQYDETNKGVMFPPFEDQTFVLNGRLNVEGDENRIVGVKQSLKRGGDPVIVLYEQVGVLFPNEKQTDNHPDYSGPLDKRADLRIAGWKGQKNRMPYLQLRVSPKGTGKGGPRGVNMSDGGSDTTEQDSRDFDGEIPF